MTAPRTAARRRRRPHLRGNRAAFATAIVAPAFTMAPFEPAATRSAIAIGPSASFPFRPALPGTIARPRMRESEAPGAALPPHLDGDRAA